MKRSWLMGIILAMTMAISGIGFASTTNTDGYSEPIYDTMTFTSDTADPIDSVIAEKVTDNNALASKPEFSGRIIVAYTVLSKDKKETTCLHFESQPLTVNSKIPIAI